MDTPPRSSPPSSTRPRRFAATWEAAIALLAGAAAAGAAAAAAGRSLGLVLGGFFAIAILAPTLAGGAATAKRLTITLAASVGVAAVWLSLIESANVPFVQWIGITMVLMSFAIAVSGLAAALEAARINAYFAAAIAVAAALAWLTWPIWLSPQIAAGKFGHFLAIAVRLHPPLVANGILTFTPPWTEQAIAYQLTILNQDVAVELPTTPWACISIHLIAGSIFMAIAYLIPPKTSGASTLAENSRDIGPM